VRLSQNSVKKFESPPSIKPLSVKLPGKVKQTFQASATTRGVMRWGHVKNLASLSQPLPTQLHQFKTMSSSPWGRIVEQDTPFASSARFKLYVQLSIVQF
jgi:hypothetical protein